jgi:hypothetical protein
MLTFVVESCDEQIDTHNNNIPRMEPEQKRGALMPGALNGVIPQFRTFAVLIIR